MGMFSFRGKNKADPTPPSLEDVIEWFQGATPQPVMKLQATDSPTTVFDSKLGGTPYLPPGFDYPYNQNPDANQRPLKLLAQLNFAQLPPLPGFPTEGILQFYLPYEHSEDTYGANFDDLTTPLAFRVVYHDSVLEDEAALLQPPSMAISDGASFPLDGELALEATLASHPMTPCDFRFDDFFLPAYNQAMETDIGDLSELEDGSYDTINDVLSEGGHQVGGYPHFTQIDPRAEDQALQEHTVLLLQVDSDYVGDEEINWGSSGVANFFITPEALARRDFSNVIFTWDCF